MLAPRWQHLGTRLHEKTCFKPCAKDVYLPFQDDERYLNRLRVGETEGSATAQQYCHTSCLGRAFERRYPTDLALTDNIDFG